VVTAAGRRAYATSLSITPAANRVFVFASFPSTPPFLSRSTAHRSVTTYHCAHTPFVLSSALPLTASSQSSLHLLRFFSASPSTWPSTSPTEYHRAAVSCILSSHLPSHVAIRTSLGSLSSTSTLPPPNMAFNITSDGSPTPRKGPARYNMPSGDLRIDTSPEVLGQASGSSQNYFPHGLHPSFGSSLTTNLQGLKRPLGISTMGNTSVSSMQQQNHFGGFKVSQHPIRSHCSPLVVSFTYYTQS
jgi:hypothetical protein